MSEPSTNLPDNLTAVSRLLHTMTTEGDSAPPIAIGASTGHHYQRRGNETVRLLESGMALLEGGGSAVCFDCGISAINHTLLTLGKPGQTALFDEHLYWGTRRLQEGLAQWGMNVLTADFADGASLAAGLAEKPALVFFEPITNPGLNVIDVAAVSQAARAAGAMVIVDNTLMPGLCEPLAMGADIVIHSLTKYINGHGDALGGAVIGNDEKLMKRIRHSLENFGGVLSPFAAYLHVRGLKTLHLRMPRHCSTAMAVAEHFADHPKVTEVQYSGLASDAGHELASRQFSDFGGVLAMGFVGCDVHWRAFGQYFRLVRFLASLGETETLGLFRKASLRATGERGRIGRFAIGLEDPADIIADIDQAIDKFMDPSAGVK